MAAGDLGLNMGQAAQLPQVLPFGSLYITEDTNELYVGGPNSAIRISDIFVVNNKTALQSIQAPLANKFYYVRSENTFYTYTNNVGFDPVGSGVFTQSSGQIQADKLKTARSIALTGDVTGTVNFDGSDNVSISTDIANSGVTAGTYGNNSDVSVTDNSTFLIPKLSIAADGRVTSASTITVTMPASMGLTGSVISDSSSGTNNTSSIANGSVRLNLIKGSTVVASHRITGSGATNVTAANGTITISSQNDNTTYGAADGLQVVAGTGSDTTDFIIKHTNSVTNGTASGSATATKNFGDTFDIPTVTYDSQGHITGKGTTTLTLPSLAAGTGISIAADGKTINHSNAITAGTAQGTATGTVGFGGTISIPKVTYDAQGHITGVDTTVVTLPSAPSDKDVSVSVDNSSKAYIAGTTSSTGGDGALVINENVFFQSDGLHANVTGNVTGTASRATADEDGSNIKNTYAPKASPAFSGTPTAPTAAVNTNSTQVATTEFVMTAIANLGDGVTFRGTLGTGGTITALPTTYKVGDQYRIITAGTYAGKVCEVGDFIIALVACTTAGNGSNDDWAVAQGNIDGAVTTGTTNSRDQIDIDKPNDSTLRVTHKTSGVTAGTYAANTGATTPAFGGKFKVPKVAVNGTGHVTSAEEVEITLPAPEAASGGGITIDSNNKIKHSNTVTAGTASGTATGTLPFQNTTLDIPTVTYDANGHITGKGTTTVNLPVPVFKTATQWTTANTVLGAGQIGYEVPSGGIGTGPVSIKVGDGTTAWASLPYAYQANTITAGTVSPSTGTVTKTINVPTITYDSQGRITSTSTNNVTLDFVHCVKSTTEPSSNLELGMLWLNFTPGTS